MKLFWQSLGQSHADGTHCVVVFGSGLIGGQLQEVFKKEGGWHLSQYTYKWDDAVQRNKQLSVISSDIRHVTHDQKNSKHKLDVIWAAGKAGFSATQEEMDEEFSAFIQVFAHFEKLSASHYLGQAQFHLISSAGGLFEGQRLVGSQSEPDPQRPYGVSKLKQEEVVLKDQQRIIPVIYRPSSVYGFNRLGDRIGLIAALLRNASQDAETVIYGHLTTLRDFVLADDVAHFIHAKVMRPNRQKGVYLLASGKPSSMVEVISKASRIENRNIRLRYAFGDTNVADNTFRPDGLPEGWRTTPLRQGMSKVSKRIKTLLANQ